MNGRAPAYRMVNEQTLVKNVEGRTRFFTFWKSVHQQLLISKGTIEGLTYTVESTKVVSREDGNAFYLKCRANGWTKWADPHKSLGKVLY